MWAIIFIQESLNHILISFWNEKEYSTAIYDKISGSVEVCNGILVTSFYRMGFGNYFVQDGYVYNIVDAILFKIIADEVIKNNTNLNDKYIKEISEINQRIDDDSNPVIIKYKLK